MKTPLVLCILDGFGIAPEGPGNAIFAAETPNLTRLIDGNPKCQLQASGMDVGLPEGQMGNSEVGHTNIGAGRVVFQDLPRITKSIQDGDFYSNPVYSKAMDACLKSGGALHLMGLTSDGGVHSHISHTFALLEMAKRHGLTKVYLHCFMDGRDVPPTSGKDYILALQDKCRELGVGQIATVMGRYYAMDRDKRWERVEKAYNAMVLGEGEFNPDPADVMQKSYDAEVTDEFVAPAVCVKGAVVNPGDSIIFSNFRPDRAREITRTFVDPDFGGFERQRGFLPVQFVCTTQYDAEMPNVEVAFGPRSLDNTMGEYLSKLGMTQLRIAETEKYAHVTFFFNGGVEAPYEGEDRVLIPSPKVATYDLKPEMSAYEVADAVVERVNSGKYDVVILNFANCDMVGHTGVFQAAKAAVEAVDACVGRVAEAVDNMNGILLITADHGNADQMMDGDGEPFTAHTTNPVPFVVVGADVKLRDGRLCDIAPTMLDLMSLEQPQEMDGRSLIL